ncbi:hypothetical protein [Methylomonas sp. MgM2]
MSDYKSRITLSFHIRFALINLLCIYSISNSVLAVEELRGNDYLAHFKPVSDEVLSEMRGGFELPNGMNLYISIARSVNINGVETLSSNFQLPDNFQLVQNGLDNHVQNVNLPVLSDVIQNSLDNQLIQSVRIVNVELSNLRSLTNNHGSVLINHVVSPNL